MLIPKWLLVFWLVIANVGMLATWWLGWTDGQKSAARPGCKCVRIDGYLKLCEPCRLRAVRNLEREGFFSTPTQESEGKP